MMDDSLSFPAHADRMHRFDPEQADAIWAYVRDRLAMAEAPLDGLGDREEVRAALDGLITDEGRPTRDVLDVYTNALAESILSADSPRFFAFIPAAPTKASLLFDMVVSAASLQGISWLEAAGAVAAENQAIRTMAGVLGLPPSSGGVFVSGGSAGNLSALVVARDTARRVRARDGRSQGPLRVVVSDQAHSSIAASLHITDMQALVVPTVDGRLDAKALAAGLDGQPLEDIAAIVCTGGTTNAGIVDDIEAVSDVAARNGWWLHVDAAYGGAAMLAPSVRHRFRGIERADSVVMDPHKWWFAPYDSAVVVYRDPHLAKAVHTQDASYLDVIHDNPDDLNPSDLAYHLTRRARGLALWFSLAVNGLAAYRDAVEQGLALARYAADRIRRHPQLELVREPDLSVLLFRRRGWSLEDYEAWGKRLLAEQKAFVTHSSWRGEPLARLVFLHPATTTAMVDEVLDSL